MIKFCKPIIQARILNSNGLE